jgi:hypothetical protein
MRALWWAQAVGQVFRMRSTRKSNTSVGSAASTLTIMGSSGRQA